MFGCTRMVIEGNWVIVDINQLRYKLRLFKIYSTTNNETKCSTFDRRRKSIESIL